MRTIYYLFIIWGLISSSFAQDYIQIPVNATIQVRWIAPPDTDVVEYRAYWVGMDSAANDTTHIRKWYTNNAPGDMTNSMYLYEQHLPLGHRFVEMTAIDWNGNESDRSNTVYYKIMDIRPGAPGSIMIKVIK